MTELMGLTPAEPAKHKDEGADYPKWIAPHRSLVDHDEGGNVSVAAFQWNRDRHGNVTVMVHDAAEEARATLAEPAALPAAEPTA